MVLKNRSLKRSEKLPSKEPRKYKIVAKTIKKRGALSITKEKIKFKNLKHSREKFKDKESRLIVDKIIENFSRTRHISMEDYAKKHYPCRFEAVGVIDAAKKLINLHNNNLIKTKGEAYHFFLPLDGMSPGGYFYKGILEQIAPKARVTFLVTPSSSGGLNTQSLSNLKKNLSKFLNKFDKHFIVIDYITTETKTMNKISLVLSEIYDRPIEVEGVYSPEHNKDLYIRHGGVGIKNVSERREHNRSRNKDSDGSKSVPISERYKQEFSYWNLKLGKSNPNYNKEIYKRLKLDEKVKAYTYYYLGNEFIHEAMKYNREIKAR